MKRSALALSFALVLGITGCSNDDSSDDAATTTEATAETTTTAADTMTTEPAAEATGNIVEVADKAGSFTTLLAAAKAAGLDSTLTSGEYTVFAPTDEAFTKALASLNITADQLLAIVKRVDPSPWFGVNFDSGNFNSADPYADLERVAPYAMNAQLKVSVTAAGQRQRSNFARVVNILKQAGYRGYLVLEYEEPEEPRERIPAILDELRTLIA